MPDDSELTDEFVLVSSDDDNEEESMGFFKNLKQRFSEGSKIDINKLDEILSSFKNQLISKNVAEEIASQICENLKEKLKNQKT